MKSLGFVGKLMYALVMAAFGVGHLTNAEMMAGMVPDYMPDHIKGCLFSRQPLIDFLSTYKATPSHGHS